SIMLSVESIQRALTREVPDIERAADRLSRVEAGAKAIRLLTDNLLAFQQIDDTEDLLGSAAVDTRRIVEDVVAAAYDVAEVRHQRLTLHCTGEHFSIGTSEWVVREAL